MDANYGQIIWDFINSNRALVIATITLSVATIISGIMSARAVLRATRHSDKVLDNQLEFDKKQHNEQLEQSEKQHQVQGLLVAFRLLDSPEHRKSRKRIFELYFQFLNSNNNVQIFSQTETGDIMADFDVMGKLVENDNISVYDFLNVYGSLAYRCWKILEIHIRTERKKRGLEKFMSNFEGLAIDGYIYWDEVECQDIDDTILYNTNPKPSDTPPSITIKKIIKNTEDYFSKLDSSRKLYKQKDSP